MKIFAIHSQFLGEFTAKFQRHIFASIFAYVCEKHIKYIFHAHTVLREQIHVHKDAMFRHFLWECGELPCTATTHLPVAGMYYNYTHNLPVLGNIYF